MGEREAFTVEATGGTLGGWVVGDGVPVLLLHGGPGLSYEYLDGLGDELGTGFRVAAFQQRGLEPSTLKGPFTIPQAIDDVIAVLDGLGWPQAVLVGHSWGGHLVLRAAAAHPDRLRGVLAVDPIGVVGDGGTAAFEAEMGARTPEEGRARAQELDKRAMAGKGTPEDALEGMAIMWPAYFADPENAAPMPSIRMSIEAYSGLIGEMSEGLEDVAASLAHGTVPYGVVAGAASPIPWGQAAHTTAELSPRAFLEVVLAAGHFPWPEVPGSVRTALQRLIA
ncbi:MAG: alpha/beta fold hydrolase [Solirubrobacteraceae bacterium]